MDVYFTITNNCNLQCAHCCVEAGQGQPSISIEDAKRVIDNLPSGIERLLLTGGEVFTKKRLLYEISRYAKSQLSGTELIVQTNGTWATSEAATDKVLDEIQAAGIDKIDVSSNTRYHREAGVDFDKKRMLNTKLKERKLGENWAYGDTQVFPMGRALNLDKRLWQKRKKLDIMSVTCAVYPRISLINHEGYVRPCCISVPGTELGNAINEKVDDIIERSKDNPKFSKMKDGMIRFASTVLNEEEMDVARKNAQEYGTCYACLELFKTGKVRLLEA